MNKHQVPVVASNELFDCPYCGGRPVYAFCLGEHWVRCNTEMCQYETDFHKSEAEAKDAWNKQVLASRLILNKSNPAGLRSPRFGGDKQHPVVGQPELNNKANRPESEE